MTTLPSLFPPPGLPVILLAALMLCAVGDVKAQGSPRPTAPPGANAVSWDKGTNVVTFSYAGKVLYTYAIEDAAVAPKTAGTLHGLSAVGSDGRQFRPSEGGGVTAEFGRGGAAVVRDPGTQGVTYALRESGMQRDTLRVVWRMTYDEAGVRDAFEYSFRFHIEGRTLVLRVRAEDGSPKAAAFLLDRCEDASGARVVAVPYLTLFNLLFANGGYASLFFDWERTGASRLEPVVPEPHVMRYSPTSVRFAQSARYDRKTDGTRNLLDETIYITIGAELEDVLPNLPGPVAPKRAAIAKKTVFAWNPPFSWLMDPCCGYTFNYLDSLHALGVRNVAVLVKNYQQFGFDHGLPDVLPANQFATLSCAGPGVPAGGAGGNAALAKLRDHVVNDLQYDFALHEQYVDFYASAPSWRQEDAARKSSGEFLEGWTNCDKETARIMKPSRVRDYAGTWSAKIKQAVHPTWSYIDVHTAIDPGERVDFDAGVPGAGLFRATLGAYRALAGRIRSAYGGPVQGEGHHHFLYAGYYDDFEARLHTANYRIYGHRAPLLVDFDLRKMHPKSARHGVGHYDSFFAGEPGTQRAEIAGDDVLTYIATELAYGHGGLITKHNLRDHALRQAVLEAEHVQPLQEAIATATPVSIRYGEALQTAGAYIRDHPDYDDVSKPGFMGKVRVEYSNGAVVLVNRSATAWNGLKVGRAGGWFAYHRTAGGGPELGKGKLGSNQFSLPPGNGWVVYLPGK